MLPFKINRGVYVTQLHRKPTKNKVCTWNW